MSIPLWRDVVSSWDAQHPLSANGGSRADAGAVCSKHRWFQDAARSRIYYAQLEAKESTRTGMAALLEVIEREGMFCARHSDRAATYSAFTNSTHTGLGTLIGLPVGVSFPVS